MLLSGALSLLCGRRSAGAPIKASLFAQRSWIDQFHLHPRQGVIPCVISLRHIFALLVILNRFSRLTRRGAKKKVQRGEKKKKKKKDRWRGSQRWKGETDRDRCAESEREKPESEKWESERLNERDRAAVHSSSAVAGVCPGLAARGWEWATVAEMCC